MASYPMEEITGKWVIETVMPDLAIMLKVDEVLYSGHTGYQRVEVVHSEVYGRSLLLDGKTQSTERDEHIYHETLVHPAMMLHPDPRRVFIGGGGEGGTLRETLAHRSVEKVTMVDLDQQVVELCREHLPQHHRGAFDDGRTELVFDDARGFLENTDQRFDVMIMDLVDPGGRAGIPPVHRGILRNRARAVESWRNPRDPVRPCRVPEPARVLYNHIQNAGKHLRLLRPVPGPHSILHHALGVYRCIGHPTARSRRCGS